MARPMTFRVWFILNFLPSRLKRFEPARRFRRIQPAASGRVEGRIEIDEVHGFVLEVTPEDVEVVAVIERAHDD